MELQDSLKVGPAARRGVVMRSRPPVGLLGPSSDLDMEVFHSDPANPAPEALLEKLANERVVPLLHRAATRAAAQHPETLGLADHRFDLDRRQRGRDLGKLRRDALQNRGPHQELLLDQWKVADDLLGE